MSKRVYEVARELGLSTREVMKRLNDAGVGVKSHFAVVEDPVYNKVFGDGLRHNGSERRAPHIRLEAHRAQALPYSTRRSRILAQRRLGRASKATPAAAPATRTSSRPSRQSP